MEWLIGALGLSGCVIVGGLFWLMRMAGQVARLQEQLANERSAKEAYKHGEEIFAKPRGADSDVIDRL